MSGDRPADERDTTPALGTPGAPASWRRAEPDADVAHAAAGFADARWSFLYGADTAYADVEPGAGQVRDANRRGRGGPLPAPTGDPPAAIVKPPVWTWEVPTYFWFGGIASGAAFVGLACDLAGDHRSARVARLVSMGALGPCPPLLIADLGRPARFLNMLRIVKPRSPMSLGVWALTAFGAIGSVAVAADALGRPRLAARAGALNAVVGGYLGSYTGVLLASTSVPVWSRSRLLLGPIFVATAAATGAAACRLTLVARGLPRGHPTRTALGTLETGAMLAEVGLSMLNERRLGPTGVHLERGRAGLLFRMAKAAVGAGLALRLARRPDRPWPQHVSSGLFLGAGLAFRWAWIEAGRTSARDHEGVARVHRVDLEEEDVVRRLLSRRMRSVARSRRAGAQRRAAGAYAEGVRRLSLWVERRVRRG